MTKSWAATETEGSVPFAPRRCNWGASWLHQRPQRQHHNNNPTMMLMQPGTLIISLLCLLTLSVATNYWDDVNSDRWSTCSCPKDRPDNVHSARIAYLISVHNKRTITDAAYLVKALLETSYKGDVAAILIHVDKRVGIKADGGESLYEDSPLKTYVDSCLASECTTDNSDGIVLEVHSHFAPEWSKWSMNDPTLWGMDYLLHHARFHGPHSKWDVFINLSGDTLPVVTSHRISELFAEEAALGNANFVTSSSCVTGLHPTSIYHFPKHWMKRAHYFQHDIPKKLTYQEDGEWRNDAEITIYFGSQWMALQHQFVEYIIRSMEHPNGLGNILMETLAESEVLMTDETFFATILMNSHFNTTIPKLNDEKAVDALPSMKHLRYERMDENNPDPWGKYTSVDPLYDIPPKFANATNGEGAAKPWGPYFLGIYDLGSIKDSGALFVRKVSRAVDENLVRMLPVEREGDMSEWELLPDIRWPRLGVDIHDPFVWSAASRKKKKTSVKEEK